MATQNEYQEYQLRLELAAGHRKFGIVSARKEPREDDEDGGGTGDVGLDPPYVQRHPLLSDAAQFSGDFDPENPNIAENPEGKKELQNRYEAQLDKKLQEQKHINPTPHGP